MGRVEMSKRELGRVELLARVKSGQLRVVDAALLMGVSYRQAKRLWKRYREEGAAGLKHRSAGRASNRAYGEGFRRRVLGLVREKYGGEGGERFGPTLAAEHLRSEDGQEEEVKRHFVCKRWTIERAFAGSSGILCVNGGPLRERVKAPSKLQVKRQFVCKRWTIERAGESSIETPWFGTRRLNIGTSRFLLPSLPWPECGA